MKTLIEIAEDLEATAAEIKTFKCDEDKDTYIRRDKLNIFDNIWRENPALLRHAVESIKDASATLDEWLTRLSNEDEHDVALEAYWATEELKRRIYYSARFYVDLLYDGK